MPFNRLFFPETQTFAPDEDIQQLVLAEYALGKVALQELKPKSYDLTPATFSASLEHHKLVINSPHDATYTVKPKNGQLPAISSIATLQAAAERATEIEYKMPEDRTLIVLATLDPAAYKFRIWDAILYTEHSVA